MSEKFKIEISTTADTTGAEKQKQALKEVAAEAQKVGETEKLTKEPLNEQVAALAAISAAERTATEAATNRLQEQKKISEEMARQEFDPEAYAAAKPAAAGGADADVKEIRKGVSGQQAANVIKDLVGVFENKKRLDLALDESALGLESIVDGTIELVERNKERIAQADTQAEKEKALRQEREQLAKVNREISEQEIKTEGSSNIFGIETEFHRLEQEKLDALRRRKEALQKGMGQDTRTADQNIAIRNRDEWQSGQMRDFEASKHAQDAAIRARDQWQAGQMRDFKKSQTDKQRHDDHAAIRAREGDLRDAQIGGTDATIRQAKQALEIEKERQRLKRDEGLDDAKALAVATRNVTKQVEAKDAVEARAKASKKAADEDERAQKAAQSTAAKVHADKLRDLHETPDERRERRRGERRDARDQRVIDTHQAEEDKTAARNRGETAGDVRSNIMYRTAANMGPQGPVAPGALPDREHPSATFAAAFQQPGASPSGGGDSMTAAAGAIQAAAATFSTALASLNTTVTTLGTAVATLKPANATEGSGPAGGTNTDSSVQGQILTALQRLITIWQ
jgi:hypothetical protein